MRSVLFTLYAAGFSALASFVNADGLEFGSTYPNGTMVIYSAANPGAGPRIQEPYFPATAGSSAVSGGSTIRNRSYICWDHFLDHRNCDDAVIAFRDALSNTESGNFFLRTRENNDWVRFVAGNVQVYACLEGRYWHWIVTNTELDIGLRGMDANCPRYKAGYMRGEDLGTFGRIIGKSRSDIPICQGTGTGRD
ncbi:hypothetical protein Micbo1qcDRAFT_209051 [Microdochium bolleyi]|uniref:Ecp2 effector protein domain-containing protein n=1 Tax=Microdochium bolleyi TaxID=196109 RepID=A0A136IN28_9PEZI|nr:hypothetical protein Micbo1qcDRAFT_209051 [Microdochium bolleyi]